MYESFIFITKKFITYVYLEYVSVFESVCLSGVCTCSFEGQKTASGYVSSSFSHVGSEDQMKVVLYLLTSLTSSSILIIFFKNYFICSGVFSVSMYMSHVCST